MCHETAAGVAEADHKVAVRALENRPSFILVRKRWRGETAFSKRVFHGFPPRTYFRATAAEQSALENGSLQFFCIYHALDEILILPVATELHVNEFPSCGEQR